MIEAKDNLRTDLLMALCKNIDNKDYQDVANVVDMVFANYNIFKTETEIQAYEDTNEKIIKKFIAVKKLEGLSDNTLKQYYRAINHLLQNVVKNISDVTTDDIRFYLAMYSQNGASKATVDNERRFLSTFFNWTTLENYVLKNPMLKIKRIKQDKKVKKAFTDEEIERLRANCITRRERALIEFLLCTGLRVSEVSNLLIKNVDFNKSECVCFGKGNKERIVFISEKCMYYILDYLDCRTENSKYLFCNNRNDKLSKSSIEGSLNKIALRANVNNVYPHRFRRTFATNASNKGMPIQYIKSLMGHEKIDTTMIYCDVNIDKLKSEYVRINCN